MQSAPAVFSHSVTLIFSLLIIIIIIIIITIISINKYCDAMMAYALIGSGGRQTVIRLHVGATVVASEVGDVITRDAMAVAGVHRDMRIVIK